MKKYLPFMTGVYSTAPGLMKSEGNIFDFDDDYEKYIGNKRLCRDEDISKYYCEHDFREETRSAVVAWLQSESKKNFPDFDSLCNAVQEDVAVIQLDGDKDWLAAIHLCSPNHWDPRTKIGRPFDEIHIPVPAINRTVKNYPVMLKMIVDKGPFTRFAWGIATDDRLNHHPESHPGRKYEGENTEFFVRVEKQNLIGIKEANAFIFTIRTYFYKVNGLTTDEKIQLTKAIQSMTDASLEYKGMLSFKEPLLSFLAKGTLRDI